MAATADSTSAAGSLAERLRGLAGERSSVDVAQIQLLATDELRRAYAVRWPEQQARIMDASETFLRRRMAEGDLLVRSNDGFLVVFRTSFHEAAISAATLANGLNGHFLADATRSPVPQVGVRTATVPVGDLAARLAESPFLGAVADELVAVAATDWRYQPVWDVKRETLTSWYVTPYVAGAATRLPGYQFEDAYADAARYAELDAAGLTEGEAALRRLISEGKQALVGASVHVAALANARARARVLGALDALDPSLARYRVLKIAAVPPGAPRSFLAEAIRQISARLPNVVLGAAWDEPDLAGLAACPAVAVGFSIPPAIASAQSIVPRAGLYARIAEAVSVAHAARKRLFIEGAVSHDLAARLRLLGVDNISSPTVWPPTAHPDAMLKWSAERLAT